MTPHAGTAQTFLRGASARRAGRPRQWGRERRAVLGAGSQMSAREVAAGRADGAGLAGGGRRDVGPTRRRQTRVGSLPPIRECRRPRAGCFSVGGVATQRAREGRPRRAGASRRSGAAFVCAAKRHTFLWTRLSLPYIQTAGRVRLDRNERFQRYCTPGDDTFTPESRRAFKGRCALFPEADVAHMRTPEPGRVAPFRLQRPRYAG